jgi:hypothetical protein
LSMFLMALWTSVFDADTPRCPYRRFSSIFENVFSYIRRRKGTFFWGDVQMFFYWICSGVPRVRSAKNGRRDDGMMLQNKYAYFRCCAQCLDNFPFIPCGNVHFLNGFRTL